LIAVGRDPNDQYFPLAFGVVETETKESWRWFIQLLLEDVGQHNRFVFISDQQKVKMFYSIAYHNVFFFCVLSAEFDSNSEFDSLLPAGFK
jgi:hypothetical protein